VSLFILSPEIEGRDEVEVANWTSTLKKLLPHDNLKITRKGGAGLQHDTFNSDKQNSM
jgi:hypothetical protein